MHSTSREWHHASKSLAYNNNDNNDDYNKDNDKKKGNKARRATAKYDNVITVCEGASKKQ